MSVKIYIDIDKVLQKRGMTLTQLADKTGIAKGNLSNIRKEKAITFRTLNKIASAIGETDPMNLLSVEVKQKEKL
ncbi:helix-turn-helix transcriptional regulator [Bacillus sp. AFS040349]|uniref:helix-turn-helix domain-containing protein n=1 Tax=Bacillus sp. AFS040349 TaxID=2033502 RepID=UPI000BFE0F43|nr:helix-turn-helix domain-containing protein [Bacillus sp. AFS040349]PGT81578.1 transcriptional regulator [Bacillus sp. AFS040349]